MASKPTRALFVAERPHTHHRSLVREFGSAAHVTAAPAAHGTTRVVRALLALLAFIACASVHQVAQASAAVPPTQADSFAACFAGDYALERSAPGTVHCPQHDAAPQLCELKVLGPQEPEEPEDPEDSEDSEDDAALAAPAISRSISCAPILPATGQGLRAAAATWKAQFLVASALPRGPPSSRR